MKGRRLVFSDASIADILEQADWYAAQSGPPLARRWEKAVTTAISHLLTRPARARPANSDRQHFAMQEERQSQDFPKHLLFNSPKPYAYNLGRHQKVGYCLD